MEGMTGDRQIRNGLLRVGFRPVVVMCFLALILLVSSCAPTSFIDPVKKPEDAIRCTGDGGNYTCVTPSIDPNYTFTLSNVPDGVTPYMLPIVDEKALVQKLPVDLPSQGYCLGSVLGNLVFYDNDGNLVTLFLDSAGPITLKFNDSEEKLKSGVSPECSEGLKNLIPVYLYAPQDHPEIRIWKPFQDYDKDEKGLITITFRSWGDQRIGIVVTDQVGFGPKK